MVFWGKRKLISEANKCNENGFVEHANGNLATMSAGDAFFSLCYSVSVTYTAVCQMYHSN